MRVSNLMRNPKSKILKKGYINVYSKLTPQEERGLFYKVEYKKMTSSPAERGPVVFSSPLLPAGRQVIPRRRSVGVFADSKINPSWDDTTIILCQLFSEALEKLNLQSGRKELVVLDVGCGHGNYVIDEFRHKITWACGVDLDKKFTEKNICLDEIKYANLSQMPYESDTFDIVLSLWVLEHLKDPVQVLQEIRRVLKPNGFFIFATPNKNCLPISLRRFVGIGMLVVSLNKVLYGRKEKDIFSTFYRANDLNTLKPMLEKVGFENVDLKLNYDPSYTSFNRTTFEISNALDRLFERFAPQFYKQHIVGVVRKPMYQ